MAVALILKDIMEKICLLDSSDLQVNKKSPSGINCRALFPENETMRYVYLSFEYHFPGFCETIAFQLIEISS